jgi:predicted transcriptional regulator
MPRLDDPKIKLKQKKPFIRKSLRPWDEPNNFLPNTRSLEKNNQLVNNRETIGKQLVNNRETIGEQLVNNRETIGNQLVNNEVNNRETIGKQTIQISADVEQEFQDTVYNKTFKTVCGLFGLQKMALFNIVENCKERGLLYTSPITNEFFRNTLNTDINSVKTTIQRLIKKGLIQRKEAKKGKGGYTVFSVSSAIRNAAIEAEKLLDKDKQGKWLLVGNKETIGKQLVNNKVNNKVNNPHVVSSYINTNYVGLDIPENWQGIDLSSLEAIGFNQSHLVQICRTYEKNPTLTLSPEMIQSSIDAMAFDLKYNKEKLNFQKSPAVVLLSLLKKAQPYNSVTPDKCVSPVQDALNKHNQMLLAQRTKEQQLLQQIKDTEFSVWIEELPEEELLLLCPEKEIPLKNSEKLFKTVRKKMAKEKAKDYFDAEIWPNKKQNILASARNGLVSSSS